MFQKGHADPVEERSEVDEKNWSPHRDMPRRTSSNLLFNVAHNNWILSHSKTDDYDLIEEAERWDLEPRLASLWWTSTCADERMDDITISTRTGQHRIPFVRGTGFWDTPSIQQEGRKTVWKRECQKRRRVGGEIFTSTEAMTCRGE